MLRLPLARPSGAAKGARKDRAGGPAMSSATRVPAPRVLRASFRTSAVRRLRRASGGRGAAALRARLPLLVGGHVTPPLLPFPPLPRIVPGGATRTGLVGTLLPALATLGIAAGTSTTPLLPRLLPLRPSLPRYVGRHRESRVRKRKKKRSLSLPEGRYALRPLRRGGCVGQEVPCHVDHFCL